MCFMCVTIPVCSDVFMLQTDASLCTMSGSMGLSMACFLNVGLPNSTKLFTIAASVCMENDPTCIQTFAFLCDTSLLFTLRIQMASGVYCSSLTKVSSTTVTSLIALGIQIFKFSYDIMR